MSQKIMVTKVIEAHVYEDTQMSRLSKNFNFFVLSFQWLLGSSDILVLVATNFLSLITSLKRALYQYFSWPI